MNIKRRKSLIAIVGKLESLNEELEALYEEEETYRDNIPENLQGSRRYESADEACCNLGDAISFLGDAISQIVAAAE